MDLIIGIAVGTLCGALIMWAINSRRASESQQGMAEHNVRLQHLTEQEQLLKTDLRVAQERNQELHGENERRKQEISSLREQLALTVSIKDELTESFKTIAEKGILEQSKHLREQQRTTLEDVLNPFKESITKFEKRVEGTHDESVKAHASLIAQIEQLSLLNKNVSEEANSLTRALKGDNKAQGNWGELMLERVLEASGLEKDFNYRTQSSDTNSDGQTIRPDVIVDLPDGKNIIIDSKVSLVAYEEYSALDDGSPEKDAALKRHLTSVKSHIKALSEKRYHTASGANTPEFVLLFVPIEASFAVTIRADSELYDFAWSKQIVIVSPTTLLATLRTVASLWKIEKQNRHAIDIAEQAGKLYDKFVGFVSDINDAIKAQEKAQSTLQDARKKLSDGRGNLVGQVEKLKVLGVKATKQLPDNLLDDANDD